MSYTVTRHDGVRFSLCAPGVADNAYTVEADQRIRKFWHELGPLVFDGNRPLSDAEIKRRQTRESHARCKARNQESPPIATAVAHTKVG